MRGLRQALLSAKYAGGLADDDAEDERPSQGSREPRCVVPRQKQPPSHPRERTLAGAAQPQRTRFQQLAKRAFAEDCPQSPVQAAERGCPDLDRSSSSPKVVAVRLGQLLFVNFCNVSTFRALLSREIQRSQDGKQGRQVGGAVLARLGYLRSGSARGPCSIEKCIAVLQPPGHLKYLFFAKNFEVAGSLPSRSMVSRTRPPTAGGRRWQGGAYL